MRHSRDNKYITYKNTNVMKVVGTTHMIQNIKYVMQLLDNDSDSNQINDLNVRIVNEPSNPYDSNAKRVEINNIHVGYVPRNGIVPSQDSRVVRLEMDDDERYPIVWVSI